jgi:NAD(P)H-flavin reductase
MQRLYPLPTALTLNLQTVYTGLREAEEHGWHEEAEEMQGPEMVETTLDLEEVDYDTGTTGDQHLTLDGASSAAPQTHVLSDAAQSKLDAATDVFLEAEVKVDALRQIATEYEKKESSRRALA